MMFWRIVGNFEAIQRNAAHPLTDPHQRGLRRFGRPLTSKTKSSTKLH